ncbi:cell envelope integrity protein TolA [uncultured Sulfitobacter sp.]|uniref:cell envelope integrity protein TolA n=1 Tax=uncultured Sulfitobacter sp. TaxID=191468 RepID=UPI00261A3390|nr:cell envelope integrity protein TolA [uncultured Sulfitobacter sp.]
MMRRSFTAKLVSLLIAIGAVAGAAQLAAPIQSVQIRGGGPQVQTQIGSDFEDLVAGTLTAQPVTAQATKLTAQKVVSSVRSTPAVSASVPEAAQPAPTLPKPATAVSSADVVASSPVTAPVPTALLAPATEAVVATAAQSDAPTMSKRPLGKNPQLAAAAEQKAEKLAQERAKAAPRKTQTAKGNATRNSKKGVAQGNSRKAKAKTAGKTKKPAARAGSGSASSYPGKVMRRLSRQSRPRVRAKGTAVIAFSISSGGGLSRVSVARSSGSAALDRAAVAMVRKAAPFPRPPSGAQRKFSVNIKGR